MSANFYTDGPKGLMVGVDLHDYVAAVGAAGVPMPDHPYGVISELRMPSKHTSTVSAETNHLWQQGGKVLPLHIPFPAPLPHPVGEALAMVAIHLSASSEGKLVKRSVTGDGAPLACCAWACFGANFNCGDVPFARFTNLVLCFGSVKTEPTLGDFIMALLSAMWDVLLKELMKWLTKVLFGDLVEKLFDWLKGKVLVPLLQKLLKVLSPILDPKILDPILNPIDSAAEKLRDFLEKQLLKAIGKALGKGTERGEAHAQAVKGLVVGSTTALEGAT